MRRLILLVAILLTTGCSGDARKSARARDPGTDSEAAAGGDSLKLVWKFSPTDGEADDLRALLERLAGGRASPLLRDERYPAELYRIQGDRAGARFLLFAYQPRMKDANGAEIWGHSFYLIQHGEPGLTISAPWSLLDAEMSTVEVLSDVNQDGLIDIVYCERFEGGEPPGRAHAITYERGAWREVDWQPMAPATYCP